jgi:hypothetical protein
MLDMGYSITRVSPLPTALTMTPALALSQPVGSGRVRSGQAKGNLGFDPPTPLWENSNAIALAVVCRLLLRLDKMPLLVRPPTRPVL